LFEECAEILKPDAVIVVRGRVETDRPNGTANGNDDEGERPAAKIIAEGVYDLDDPRLLAWKKNATVQIQVKSRDRQHLPKLRSLIDEHRGSTPVTLLVESTTSVDEINLSDEIRVEPSAAFERAVENLLGRGSYRMDVLRAQARQTNGSRAGSKR
jgi:hypothetical protein